MSDLEDSLRQFDWREAMNSVPPPLVSEGRYGTELNVYPESAEQLMRLLEQTRARALTMHGIPDNDLSFLCDAKELEALTVFASSINVAPLECLRGLKMLSLNGVCHGSLYFDTFHSLRDCSVDWSIAVAEVLALRTLKRLAISHLAASKVPHLGELDTLQDLSLFSCRAESLEPLRNLTNLETLRLALFRKLKDNVFLSNLTNLKDLWIQSCTGFGSLEPLRHLTKLERINIEDSGPFESLKPLSNLRNLRTFILGGPKKQVLDRDYESVENLPELEIFFK